MLDVVVGGQFGSEAKGHVTSQVIQRRMDAGMQVVNVRVAGPNAGHCVLDEKGNKFALRSVPVGAVHDGVALVVAPGSEVELAVLVDEITTLEEAGHSVRNRMWVSPEATVLTDDHKFAETGMHERMGSTGKGIGAARADRIMRNADRIADNQHVIDVLASFGVGVADPLQLDGQYTDLLSVVIEGTQGYGLGLHAGYYPQCTSSDTRAIDFCAMAAVNPWDHSTFNVHVVARVFPIRVAGNSGPLLGETSWEDLGLPEERTTVTKKVRRVGAWDADLIFAAVEANGRNVSTIALTMLDQLFEGVKNETDKATILAVPGVGEFIDKVEADSGAKVTLVTTGERTGAWIR